MKNVCIVVAICLLVFSEVDASERYPFSYPVSPKAIDILHQWEGNNESFSGSGQSLDYRLSEIRLLLLESNSEDVQKLATDIQGLHPEHAFAYFLGHKIFTKLDSPIRDILHKLNLTIEGPSTQQIDSVTDHFAYYKGFDTALGGLDEQELVLRNDTYSRKRNSIFRDIDSDLTANERTRRLDELIDGFPSFPRAPLINQVVSDAIRKCENIGNSSFLKRLLEGEKHPFNRPPEDHLLSLYIKIKELTAENKNSVVEVNECVRSYVFLAEETSFSEKILEKSISDIYCSESKAKCKSIEGIKKSASPEAICTCE